MKCLRVAQLLRDAGERLSPTNRTKCCVTNANSETFYSVFLFSTYVLPVKKACDVWINLDFMEISSILWPVQGTGEWTTVFSYVTGVINCLSRSFTTIACEKRKKILHLYIFLPQLSSCNHKTLRQDRAHIFSLVYNRCFGSCTIDWKLQFALREKNFETVSIIITEVSPKRYISIVRKSQPSPFFKSLLFSLLLVLCKLAKELLKAGWNGRKHQARCTILPKVLGRPLLMNRFDYFSNFYEYKS